MTSPHVLIVDDEPDLRWVLRGMFEDAGFTVTEAGDGREALAKLESASPDVILSDVRMPHVQGLDLLRAVKQRSPDLPVVLLSAVEDIATAVGAIQEGAFDYQSKPFDQQRLLLTVQRAAEQHALRREVHELRSTLHDRPIDFGASIRAQELRRKVELVAAQTSVAVLIVGESGTGKEVVARAVHQCSPNAEGPFVAVDCGALPEPLMESQLFGHKKGAFTGADRDKPGLFQMADGGTLFLDELGNLPLALQSKLLRALQERAVVPVGGSEPVAFTARLVCATNADLAEDVRRGRFRMDLFHRVAEFTLRLPPLRERPEDVVHFARLFLAEANREMGRRVQGFTPAAETALARRAWPGNLRELRNAVRRAVLLCTATMLDADDLAATDEPGAPPATAAAGAREGAAGGAPASAGTGGKAHGSAVAAEEAADHANLPLQERVRLASDALEARILQEALAAAGGNKAAAARALRIDYTTLHRKLKRHELL